MWVGKNAALHCSTYYNASCDNSRTSGSDLPDDISAAPAILQQRRETWDLPRGLSSEGALLHAFRSRESIAMHADRTGGLGEEPPAYRCTLGFTRRARSTYELTPYNSQLAPAAYPSTYPLTIHKTQRVVY
ncbi:hypothetical protein Bbelb_168260 [Branchiostoma belcheri]|nr:hypothetical protein Bbelb_168260 [Branchiostoma belcheri]